MGKEKKFIWAPTMTTIYAFGYSILVLLYSYCVQFAPQNINESTCAGTLGLHNFK